MATSGIRFEGSREMLSQAIVESLNSWPELQRRVFVETHYHNRPIEEIAREMGMTCCDVVQILEHCERSLFRALKAFRDGETAEAPQEPPHPVSYSLRACCH